MSAPNIARRPTYRRMMSSRISQHVTSGNFMQVSDAINEAFDDGKSLDECAEIIKAKFPLDGKSPSA